MLHLAESIAIAQSRRQSVEEFHNDVYRRLEASSTDAPDGMVWEARIAWADGTTDFVGAVGYILAARSFGTLLSALHARGFLTGEHDPHERLAGVARVAA